MHTVAPLRVALGLYLCFDLGNAIAAGLNLTSKSNTAAQPQTSVQAANVTMNQGCIGLTIASWTDVFYPNSDVYENENQNYWSLTEVLSPSCVFRPNDAQAIGDAIKVLERTNTQFAVRGGGHMGVTVRTQISLYTRRSLALALDDDWANLGRVQTTSTMAF